MTKETTFYKNLDTRSRFKEEQYAFCVTAFLENNSYVRHKFRKKNNFYDMEQTPSNKLIPDWVKKF